METKTAYKHIVEDETGDAYVEGTRISVAQLVRTLEFGKKASESDIERVVSLYPEGYLTPAKIYAAFSYFSDHREKVLRHLGPDIPPGFERDGKGNLVHKG